jgi:type IX secretion system PorP/SprF family membrane protein
MNKIFTTLIMSSFWAFVGMKAYSQQQPLYSQYMFNGVVINPAHMAMENEYSNFTLMNRQQWVGIKGAPKTTTLSINTPINATKTSIGLLGVNDQAGSDTQTEVNLLVSQSISLAENAYLAVGASAGINILKENDLSLNASYDPLFNRDRTSTRGDVGFGISFFTDRFFIGFSAPSFRKLTLKTTNNYDVKGDSHYYLSCGYLFDIAPSLKFKPTVLVKKIGEGRISQEVTANFLLNNVIWIGAGWRESESIIGITQFQMTNSIKLSYSYDYVTKRELQTIQQGSHEIALSFRFGRKGRIVSPSYF